MRSTTLKETNRGGEGVEGGLADLVRTSAYFHGETGTGSLAHGRSMVHVSIAFQQPGLGSTVLHGSALVFNKKKAQGQAGLL